MSPFTSLRWAATAAAVATLATVGVAAPAQAADDIGIVLVSPDGVDFQPRGSFALFDDAGRLVPGDERIDEFWVQSTADESGRLRLDVVDASTDDVSFADHLRLRIQVGDEEVSPSVSFADIVRGGGCYVVENSSIVPGGATVGVRAFLELDSSLGDDGTDGREGVLGNVNFQMRAVLSDPAAPSREDGPTQCRTDDSEVPPTPPTPSPTDVPPTSPAPTPSSSGGALPATGAPSVDGALAVSAGALVIGGLLAAWARSRRRRSERSE